jgi:hypothetical protein
VRRAAVLLALGLAGILATPSTANDALDTVVARVGAQEITVREVDARCGEACARLSDGIRTRKWEALQTLVDETVVEGVPPPAVPPVSDGEVEAYRAEHRQDFHGPPARDQAAIRFYLARERRRRVEETLAQRERERRRPKLLVTADDRTLGDPRPERGLAEVGDHRIDDQDVENRLALVLYRLRGARHRERLRHVESLIDDAVWRSAAAEAGTTAQELRGVVAAAAPPVTDEDLERHFETEVQRQNPQAEKHLHRLRPYLEFQRTRAAEARFIESGRARLGVRVLLDAPEPPRLILGPGPGGWRGPADAPVRVVFLTSYRGDTSRAMWGVVQKVAAEPGTALTVRPLLPQWDPEATAVAAAVYCAGAQARAWELHELVASHATLPDTEALFAMAQRVGLEREPFEHCLAQPATSEAIAALSADAERLGVTEPPATLVDGLVFGGMQSIEHLREVVRDTSRPRRPD